MSKTHLENKSDNSRKVCEKCNIEVQSWANHLNSKNHLEKDPDQTTKLIGHTKLCEKCKSWDYSLGCSSKR